MIPPSRARGPALHRLGQVRAVLFDRDDTLILDVPRYHGDVSLVRPVPGAPEAVARLRGAGYRVGVVSQTPTMGHGRLTPEQLTALHHRVEQLVGPMGTWRHCSHGALDACMCNTPGPQLVLQASYDLGVRAEEVLVIGDIGSDVRAARAAGSLGILVPSRRTTAAEIREATLVAPNLPRAADMVMAARPAPVPG